MNKWIKEEVTKLKELAEESGETWSEVSEEMGRIFKKKFTANQCRKAYYRTRVPVLKKKQNK